MTAAIMPDIRTNRLAPVLCNLEGQLEYRRLTAWICILMGICLAGGSSSFDCFKLMGATCSAIELTLNTHSFSGDIHRTTFHEYTNKLFSFVACCSKIVLLPYEKLTSILSLVWEDNTTFNKWYLWESSIIGNTEKVNDYLSTLFILPFLLLTPLQRNTIRCTLILLWVKSRI